jgi:O-antigen ligase
MTSLTHRAQPDQALPGAALLAWLFPAMLLLTALDILGSGRDLNATFAHLERSAEAAAPLIERGSLQVWMQRLVSLLLIAATLPRIVAHLLRGRIAPAPLLTAAFLVYWAATIAAPGLLGAHRRVSHEYLYPLLLGVACTMVEAREFERILLLLRNALFAWIAAGLPVLLVQPQLVLDWSYSQGLLGSVPRYGGLATSPVTMGLLAQVALLVLWAEPFERRWLQRAAWGIGLAALFFAQSKTAWLSFLIGGACMYVVQGPPTPYGIAHPQRTGAALRLCVCVIAAAALALLATLLDAHGRLGDFLETREGAQLASITGRDRIWVVALAEWAQHPFFGYGLTIWDSEYRHLVNLPQATHAHNQLVDTLARAGLVGAVGLLVYAGVLLAYSLRHARAGRGLGLAMGLTLLLLSVSEVPLLLIDYGSHLLHHYLLLVSLAAAAAGGMVHATEPRPRAQSAFAPDRPVPVGLLARLAAILLPARRAVLMAGVPLLVAVGSPLADGRPPRGDELAAATAARDADIDRSGLQLAMTRGLAAPPASPVPVAAALHGEPDEAPHALVLDRTLPAR